MWACPPRRGRLPQPAPAAGSGPGSTGPVRRAAARLLPVILAVLAAWLVLVDLHLRFFFWPGKLVILLAVFAASAPRCAGCSGRAAAGQAAGAGSRAADVTAAINQAARPGRGFVTPGPGREAGRPGNETRAALSPPLPPAAPPPCRPRCLSGAPAVP